MKTKQLTFFSKLQLSLKAATEFPQSVRGQFYKMVADDLERDMTISDSMLIKTRLRDFNKSITKVSEFAYKSIDEVGSFSLGLRESGLVPEIECELLAFAENSTASSRELLIATLRSLSEQQSNPSFLVAFLKSPAAFYPLILLLILFSALSSENAATYIKTQGELLKGLEGSALGMLITTLNTYKYLIIVLIPSVLIFLYLARTHGSSRLRAVLNSLCKDEHYHKAADFCRVAVLCSEAGLPQVDLLSVASRVASPGHFKKSLQRAEALVSEGSSINEGLALGAFPKSYSVFFDSLTEGGNKEVYAPAFRVLAEYLIEANAFRYALLFKFVGLSGLLLVAFTILTIILGLMTSF